MKRCWSALVAIATPALGFATLVALIGTVVSALFMATAHAQVGTASAPPAAPASPVFGLMQGLVGLVVVVGCIYAAAWLLKKIGPRTRSAGLVHVVGGTSVGPREKVVVVRFGDRTLLLGVAPGQVSLLHSGGPDGVPDSGLDEPPAGLPANTPGFVERLRAARGGA